MTLLFQRIVALLPDLLLSYLSNNHPITKTFFENFLFLGGGNPLGSLLLCFGWLGSQAKGPGPFPCMPLPASLPTEYQQTSPSHSTAPLGCRVKLSHCSWTKNSWLWDTTWSIGMSPKCGGSFHSPELKSKAKTLKGFIQKKNHLFCFRVTRVQ